MKKELSIELKLLLLFLEDRLYDSKKEEIIKTCADQIDWVAFRTLAVRHNVLLLIYEVIKARYADCVPDSLLAEMKNTFFANSARNLYFTAVLHKIINSFDNDGIQCVPLKGPVVSEQLYGDINLRSFSDLDILVPKDVAFKAFNVLISKGFTPELILNGKQFDAYMNSEDHIILFTDEKRLQLSFIGNYPHVTCQNRLLLNRSDSNFKNTIFQAKKYRPSLMQICWFIYVYMVPNIFGRLLNCYTLLQIC